MLLLHAHQLGAFLLLQLEFVRVLLVSCEAGPIPREFFWGEKLLEEKKNSSSSSPGPRPSLDFMYTHNMCVRTHDMCTYTNNNMCATMTMFTSNIQQCVCIHTFTNTRANIVGLKYSLSISLSISHTHTTGRRALGVRGRGALVVRRRRAEFQHAPESQRLVRELRQPREQGLYFASLAMKR